MAYNDDIEYVRNDSNKQTIDKSGKTRAYETKGGMLVYIPPTYPNELEEFEINIKKYRTTPEKVKDYISKNLKTKIKQQYVENGKCRGIITQNNMYFYCVGDPLDKVKVTAKTYTPPYKLFSARHNRSLYRQFQRNKNIADILKNYVLKLYHEYEEFFSIVVKPDIDYGELDVFYDTINEQTNFYDPESNELYVESEEVKRRLETYLDISKKYIPSLMKDGVVPNVSPEDFTSRTNQLVFTNDKILKEWILNNSNKGYSKLIHNSLSLNHMVKNIYYVAIGDKIFGIQNVEGGDKKKAHYVSYMWNQNSINIGYYVKDEDLEGFKEPIKIVYDDGQELNDGYTVFAYPKLDKDDEAKYAAIIEF